MKKRDGIEVATLFVPGDVTQEILSPCTMWQRAPGRRRHRSADARCQAIERLDARVREIAVITTEQLVAAVAREDDGDVLACQLRDVPGRDGGRISERLVEVPNQPIENRHRIRPHDELMVLRAEVFGDA